MDENDSENSHRESRTRISLTDKRRRDCQVGRRFEPILYSAVLLVHYEAS